MNKIFNDAKDKNVAAVFVYGNGTDVYAYSDDYGEKTWPATAKVDAETLKDLFFKGCAISISGEVYYPVAMHYDTVGKYTSLTYITVTTVSTVETATPVTIYSKEYTVAG